MRLGFRARLIAGFSVVLVLLSLVAAAGLKGMSDLRALTNQMTSSDVFVLYYADETVNDLLGARESVLNLVMAEDDASRNQELTALEQARARFGMDFGELSKTANGEQETALVQRIGASWSEQDVLASGIVDSAAHGQTNAARALIPQFHAVANRTNDLLNEIIQTQKSDTAIARSVTNAYDRSQAQILLATGLALVLGLATAITIGTRTTRAVRDVARAARQVAGGDLGMRVLVTTGDELQVLADDFNAMAASLQRQEYERGCAEAAIGESEARYRYVMEQAGDGIIMVDSAAQVVEANPRAKELLGYDADSLLGCRLRDLMVATDLANLPVRLPPIGQTLIGERQMLRRDGRAVPVEVSITTLPDGGQIGMLRDITLRKEAEQQREALAQAEKLRALGQMARGSPTI